VLTRAPLRDGRVVVLVDRREYLVELDAPPYCHGPWVDVLLYSLRKRVDVARDSHRRRVRERAQHCREIRSQTSSRSRGRPAARPVHRRVEDPPSTRADRHGVHLAARPCM